jgi:hypothetical protein
MRVMNLELLVGRKSTVTSSVCMRHVAFSYLREAGRRCQPERAVMGDQRAFQDITCRGRKNGLPGVGESHRVFHQPDSDSGFGIFQEALANGLLLSLE